MKAESSSGEEEIAPPGRPLTATEWFAWGLLIISLLVGFGMTAFAPI